MSNFKKGFIKQAEKYGLTNNVANTIYKQTTTSHDKTLKDGTVIDVLKLIELTNNQPTTMVKLKDIKNVDRSKKTGFSSKRYAKADTSYPLLVDSNYSLLDGRHRYFKLKDNDVLQTPTRIVTSDQLLAAINNQP